MIDLLQWFFEKHLTISGQSIALREVVGGLLGLASAIFGAQRRIAAWPVGIVADGLLFTVFLGAVFSFGDSASHANYYGQAGRNLLLMLVSIYGWVRWHNNRKSGVHHAPVTPRWMTRRERSEIAALVFFFFFLSRFIFSSLGESGQWLWVDTWIFTGTALATWCMSRGFIEFWLVWIAVDVVGVPFAWSNGYYPTALLYASYLPFVLWGFISWRKIFRQNALSIQ